ncbi:hypothetical protein VTH82DRAFT_7758 [Thermothelomyces myriococcoides]
MTTELPPRFTLELEQALEQSLGPPPSATLTEPDRTAEQSLGPPESGIPTDQQSVSSSVRQRRWDDPPEEEPTAPPENITTMVFVRLGRLRPYLETEIMQLSFSPDGTHLIAMAPRAVNTRTFSPEGVFTLLVWNVSTGQRVPGPSGPSGPSHGIRLNGGFALKPAAPGQETLVVACPFLVPNTSPYDHNGSLMGRLEIYDLSRRARLVKIDSPLRHPMVWSPDSALMAGVSMLEPSRIMVVQAPNAGTAILKFTTMLLHHLDHVTHLAFLPASEHGGRALVSAGRDGFVRVTNVITGRTIMKIEIGTRAAPKLLQVSRDGRLVVTVWGRDVVLWFLDSGRVHTYNLDTVRLGEGWPLAISPDCRYLACRNEEGFDVMDVQTGKFRGEFPWARPTITAAAFNSDGTKLAVGDYYGNLQTFDVIA